MANELSAHLDDAQIQDFLKNMKDRLKDVAGGKKKYYGHLSAIIYADVMDHFKKQEGPDGKWAAWSKIYKKRAEQRGKSESNNMLKMTARLMNTFKIGSVRETSKGPIWFNNAKTKQGFPYAYHHDEGAKTTRPFMWASDKAQEKIAVQTLQFMLDERI